MNLNSISEDNRNSVHVPSISELRSLQTVGTTVGYRGFYIYLRYQAILRALRKCTSRKLLNIGCGYGIFDRLLPRTIDYTGVDLGEKQIAFAKVWANSERADFKYACGDFRNLNLQHESFDAILVSEVIEHIPEQELENFFSSLFSLLVKDGVLILSVPNRFTLRNRCRILFGKEPVIMDKTHLREYSRAEAQALVSSLPFTQVYFDTAVLYFPFENWIAKLIAPESILRKGLINVFPNMASHFIYVLKK